MITGLTPYLSFNDKCEEALNFYATALGGQIKSMMRGGDGPKEYQSPENNHKVMHSEIVLGKASVMASDSMGHECAPGSNTSLTLNFENMEEITSAWKNLSEGGMVTMDL